MILFLILFAIGYFLIVLMTMFKRGSQENTARDLIYYALVALLWELIQIFIRLGWLDFLSERLTRWIPIMGVLLLAVLFLALTRTFLAYRARGGVWFAMGWGWLAAILMTILVLSGVPEALITVAGWGVTQRLLLTGMTALGWAFMVGITAFITAKAYRAAVQPLHRNRILYWLLALSFSSIGDLMIFFGLTEAGSAIRLLGTFFAAYVLLIYDLLDVLQTGLRTLFYLLTSILTAIIYMIIVAAAYLALKAEGDYEPFLIGLALVIVLVFFMNPILRWFSQRMVRLVFGTGYSTSGIVREYSLKISNIVDLELLATVALDLIQKTLQNRSGYLFLVDEKMEAGRSYFVLKEVRQVLGYSSGEAGLKPEESTRPQEIPLEETMPAGGAVRSVRLQGYLLAENPVVAYLNQARRPLQQYDVDFLPSFHHMAPEERAWLSALGADVYVPIYDRRGWTGLIVLGSKISGQPYTNEDLNLLSTLADQTAVALENARHFADLLRLNEDIQRTSSALEKANEQLLEMDEQKSAFIGVITHEMRTPFSNLAFNLQLLEMYGKQHLLPEQRDQIKQLSTGVKTARMMVDNLITLAAFLNRQVVLKLEPLDFREVILTTCTPLKEMADEKRISFQVDMLGQLLPVTGDRKLLSNAVHQLVHNAIKFTKEGGKVWVSCWTTSVAFFLDVKDNGAGIGAAQLPTLWSSFTQTADPLRRGLEGLGLGLALVKNIVTIHGGEVWAESKQGEGSVFGFQIPLAPQTS